MVAVLHILSDWSMFSIMIIIYLWRIKLLWLYCGYIVDQFMSICEVLNHSDYIVITWIKWSLVWGDVTSLKTLRRGDVTSSTTSWFICVCESVSHILFPPAERACRLIVSYFVSARWEGVLCDCFIFCFRPLRGRVVWLFPPAERACCVIRWVFPPAGRACWFM